MGVCPIDKNTLSAGPERDTIVHYFTECHSEQRARQPSSHHNKHPAWLVYVLAHLSEKFAVLGIKFVYH